MLFVEDSTPVIVQGMTGHQGMTHTARMLKAGTNIVGGVNPRKAGMSVTFPAAKNGTDVDVPVFATCDEAREATGAKASVVFVPPKFAKSAVVEAIEAGIELIVVITEGIPVADSAYFVELALRKGVRIIGPNCPGLITLGNPGVNLGIIPDGIVGRGPLGLVSKSGTLTYQLMGELSDIGFTACLGAGGDPIVGTTLLEALQAFEADPDTKAVMMIGEIGGTGCRCLGQGTYDQASCGLHRRFHRPRRQADGPCRRHRLRRQGHRSGQEERARSGRHSRGQDPGPGCPDYA
jgi:succinyl-CoA synthetase alpha subunit